MTWSERLARRDPGVEEIRMRETDEVIGHVRLREAPDTGALAPVVDLASRRRRSSGPDRGAA